MWFSDTIASPFPISSHIPLITHPVHLTPGEKKVFLRSVGVGERGGGRGGVEGGRGGWEGGFGGDEWGRGGGGDEKEK